MGYQATFARMLDATAVDPFAEVPRVAGDPIPAPPLVSLRAIDRDPVIPADSKRETCGQIVARMERNRSAGIPASFARRLARQDAEARAQQERRWAAEEQSNDSTR